MMSRTEAFSLDSLAMQLAAEAGQAWSELCEHPGYIRNVWRDAARQQVVRDLPGAVFEILPAQWDGRDGECLVRTVTSFS